MEAFIESVDEFYSDNLAQEVAKEMREAATKGFWITSRAPVRLPPDHGSRRSQEETYSGTR